MSAARPRISLIVAADENNLIGRGNALPWHLPADLKHFKALTMGKPVLMGRRTFDSIGRVLPGRRFLVLTRNDGFSVEGCERVANLGQALSLAAGAPELMVIGGAEVYALVMPHARRIYLTRVHARLEGDAWFPPLGAEWREVSRASHPADEKNPFPYSFLLLERL